MKKMKGYKSFLKEGNFIEDFLKDVAGSEEQKKNILQTKISNFDTHTFFTWMIDKIKRGDNSPIYVYNTVNTKNPFYVMSEFHNESKLYGFEEDEAGNIVMGGNKYSYCIFNCSKIDAFSSDFLSSDLNKILSKNSQDNKRTIIEVTNFSALSEDARKNFTDLVQERKIGDYELQEGEFFIFSDNNNSSKGGENLSEKIALIFPDVNFYIIGHKFVSQEENPS